MNKYERKSGARINFEPLIRLWWESRPAAPPNYLILIRSDARRIELIEEINPIQNPGERFFFKFLSVAITAVVITR